MLKLYGIQGQICLSVCLSDGGVEAEKLLGNRLEKSRDIEGRKNTAEFRNYWRRHFSIVLQRCNSKVILNKLARVSSSSNQV